MTVPPPQALQSLESTDRTGPTMPRLLKLYIASVVAVGAFALAAATLLFSCRAGNSDKGHVATSNRANRCRGPDWRRVLDDPLRLIELGISRAIAARDAIKPSRSRRSWRRSSSAVQRWDGWVAAVGTDRDIRELRGRIPWYGTLANRARPGRPGGYCGRSERGTPAGMGLDQRLSSSRR